MQKLDAVTLRFSNNEKGECSIVVSIDEGLEELTNGKVTELVKKYENSIIEMMKEIYYISKEFSEEYEN